MLQGELEQLQAENAALREELHRFQNNENLFHELVETAVGKIGEDFFEIIAQKLSDWLGAECVIIGQLISENTVQGFPMYLDGEIVEGFTYQLTGTPCDLTSKKGYCVYEEEVGKHYPESKDIKDLNIQGYVGTALYNKQGNPNGILCAMSRKKLELPAQAEDLLRIIGARITSEIERIAANKKLEESKAKLNKANTAKDRLFSIISHDLKNPFQSLIYLSEYTEQRIESGLLDEAAEYAGLIKRTSTDTFRLLKNLLDWSRTQIDGMEFNPVELDVHALVDATIYQEQTRADEKHIQLQNKISSELIIHADWAMLETILRNLISNAIKFTPNGGHITISSESSATSHHLIIEDDGVGFSTEKISKLFNLETSFSELGTNDEKGSGLGLILCKELMDFHNGDLRVESELGKGSKITLEFPF